MLAIDTCSNELYIYNRGRAVSIKQAITKQILNSNGKLKLDVIPKQLSDKVWTINEIHKHVSSVFRLKGVKRMYTEIYTTPNPQVGDVWLCQVNGTQYVYVGKGKWQQFGAVSSIDTQLLERIVERLDILQSKLQDQISRAKAAEQQLHNQIIATNIAVANNKNLIVSLSTNIAQDLQQINENFTILSSAIQENTQILSSAIDTKSSQLSAGISSVISTVISFDDDYESIMNMSNQIYNIISNN